jgi:hypothetical protein
VAAAAAALTGNGADAKRALGEARQRAMFTEGLRLGGPREALKALMRYLNDDAVFSVIPADILERMLSNAETIISIEVPGFAGWRVQVADLERLKVPMALLVASDTLPIYKAVTDWLAKQVGVQPITVPGRHGFYFYRPQDLADVLRPIVKSFSVSFERVASGVRRDKAALSSGCKSHPANAPAGSSRSSHGGDEIAEAFGRRVTNW